MILGGIDNAYISPDEWTRDTENEPTFEDRVNTALHKWIEQGNPDAPIDWPEEGSEPTDEELAEWARTLMEEDDGPVDAEDEELYDPLVKCRICRASRPISQMNTNGECPPCQREVALMVKPQGKCVRLEDRNGVEWRL